MAEMGGRRIVITTTPEQGVELIKRLISDDEFRARFEHDTQELLAEYGIDVPSEMIPDEVKAPPPEALEQVRDQIKQRAEMEEDSFLWAFIFWSFLGVDSFKGFDSFIDMS